MTPSLLLTAFIKKAQTDKTLKTSHISLYIAIIKCWEENNQINPVSISRSELMKMSKINAKATYHKCIKELHNLSYILYQPSYHPLKKSQITIIHIPKTPHPLRPNISQHPP
ncbi:hypothetical protein [Flavobacterium sp. UBA6135]|uniref:hypothetical protein n=1 Tax=Flavobacterium sp. UBA6135 TaxID=1946553 RepID=UPI0025BCAAD9|nr:hypothetical protein [Flavobacterium sp. UBA6135]